MRPWLRQLFARLFARRPGRRRRAFGPQILGLEARITPAVPYLVADVNAVPRPSDLNLDPQGFVDVGGVAYFQATDPAHGAELWKSDGTQAGTVLVKDIYPGPHGSTNQMYRPVMAAMGGTLYFVANDGVHGAGAVEERRHRRRDRAGQGHQPGQRTAPTPDPT